MSGRVECPACGHPPSDVNIDCPSCLYATRCYLNAYTAGIEDERNRIIDLLAGDCPRCGGSGELDFDSPEACVICGGGAGAMASDEAIRCIVEPTYAQELAAEFPRGTPRQLTPIDEVAERFAGARADAGRAK